jgi:hypothetical protein
MIKTYTFDDIGKFTCKDKLDYINLLQNQLNDSESTNCKPPFFSKGCLKENEKKILVDRLSSYRKDYEQQNCGSDSKLDNCNDLNAGIIALENSLITTSYSITPDNVKNLLSQYKLKYLSNNCDKVINDSALKEVDKNIDKYQKLDKQRIETESFKQRNYRIILGAVVLVAGLLIVVTIKKD